MHPSLRAVFALAALLIAPAAAAAAPSITLTTPPEGAVYATAVAVPADYACAPDASTLATVTQCEGTVENGAPVDTATAGTKAFTVTATDADGATSSVTHNYIVDSTAPAIALTTPEQGAVFASGEAVNAGYTCADAGGSGIASCTGTVAEGQALDTTPGSHTFTVTAVDNAGNTTTVTHSYRASICTRTGTHTVSCELWARAGTIDLPGLPNVPIKTFADHSGAPAITAVGGPTLDALDGDTVSVLLHNDLGEPLALAVPQQPLAPAGSKIAPGGYATYSFVARMGTSIYEAGSASSVSALDENVGKQVAQGLYGALVVRPGTQSRQAYGTAATRYDEEALVLLSEIDPALNANPDAFDMSTFAPTYALINGRPYDGTANGTLPIVSAPGHDVLLRVVNAAVRFHPIGLLGLRESVVGESSHALRYPRSAIATTVAPGGTADALVHLPSLASAAGHYALYDTSLRLNNGTQAGYGGMLTTIDATGTWTTSCAGPVSSRVQAPDTTANGSALDFTAYVTPCAAAPATTLTDAEYFIDTVGADGSGTTLPLGPNPLAGSISAALLLTLSEGRHSIYVHGRDSTGAWGEVSSDTFVVARIGPAVRSITVDPTPTNHDPATTHLSATADATAHPGRTVAAAEYFVDPAGTPAPGTGHALTLSGTAATAAVDGDIPLASLAAGSHTIVIEAQDDLGHWGATASSQLLIDLAGPVTTAVAVSPSPNNGSQAPDGHPGVVWVTATVNDGGPNASAVKRAEGYIDPAGTPTGHTGWAMLPVDGAFDQSTEQVYAPIPLSEISLLSDGSHVFSVRGRDAAGNWGALATGTLQIDKTGPAIANGAATLTPTTTRRPNVNAPANIVRLNATATDVSLVDQFEWNLDGGTSTFVNVTPAATPGAMPVQSILITRQTATGTHTVSVRARDTVGNWSAWTQLTLTVANGFGPADAPAVVTAAGVPGTAPLVAGKVDAQISVLAMGRARLISVATAKKGTVRARFVFAPHGIKIRGAKKIVEGRDATRHTVLWVQVRGNAKHGYRMRAISGHKHSAWLTLGNRRAVLEAAVVIGKSPTLKRAH